MNFDDGDLNFYRVIRYVKITSTVIACLIFLRTYIFALWQD